MGKLVCDCLNVCIHTKTDDFTASTAAKAGLDANACAKHFPSGLIEIVLNLEGVLVEHQCLVKKRQVLGWMLHRCINCDTYTHAISNLGRVIANASLKHDSTSIDSLKQSADFSPLYKIALPDRNDNQPVRSLGVQSGKYESLQQVLTTIQQQLNKFLIEEESAMENRIREYQDTQRSAYASLQSKVRKDKNTLINTILSAEQKEIAESLTDAMSETSVAADPEQMVPSFAVDHTQPSSKSSPIQNQARPSHTGTPSKHSETNPPVAHHTVNQRLSGSPDEMDGVFDFDPGFEDNRSEAFYNSDDENDDTDDSSFADDTELSSGPGGPRNLYSASMPVSMPVWGAAVTREPRTHGESRARISSNRRSLEEEEDDLARAPDPENMAASIKALAQSVHGDGTEIFGDLPKRRTRTRIGTSDFGNL